MTEVATDKIGSVSSPGSFYSRSQQTLDASFPLYHGVIDCQTAMDRLGTVSSPGAFLVRNTGWRWDHVITYLDQTLDIKHIIISFGKNTDLKKHNPHIKNLQTAVEVMVSLDPKRFIHEVHWTKFNTLKVQRFKSDLKNLCYVCEKEYNDKSEKNHLTSHKLTYCESCLGLVAQRSIFSHKMICEKRPGVFKCHICDFVTRWKYSLNFHNKTNKHIQCQHCQKYCESSDRLERHLKLHVGYECSFCGKHFKTEYGMTRHEKANHIEKDKETENKAFRKEETHTNGLDSSKESSSVNAQELTPSSTRRKFFQCKLCDYQGDSKNRVKRHEETRHNRKPVVFKCEFCADFSTKEKRTILHHKKNACPSLSEESHVVWFDA